jgi:hypothetical protein
MGLPLIQLRQEVAGFGRNAFQQVLLIGQRVAVGFRAGRAIQILRLGHAADDVGVAPANGLGGGMHRRQLLLHERPILILNREEEFHGRVCRLLRLLGVDEDRIGAWRDAAAAGAERRDRSEREDQRDHDEERLGGEALTIGG